MRHTHTKEDVLFIWNSNLTGQSALIFLNLAILYIPMLGGRATLETGKEEV